MRMKEKKILLVLCSLLLLSAVLIFTTSDKKSSAAVDENYTGFAEDGGNWYYYQDGEVATSLTTIIKGEVKGQTAWWYINGGKVYFITGARNTGKYMRYIKNGKAQLHYDGFAKGTNGWYYFVDGKVATDMTTIVKGEANGKTAWWYIVNGKITFVTRAVNTGKKLRYIRNGKAQLHYTGFAMDETYDWYYFEDGLVAKTKTDVIHGVVNGTTAWWYVHNGKVEYNYYPIVVKNSSNGNWYVVRNGRIDFNYNGMASNDYGKWYVVNGKVIFNKTGLIYDQYNGNYCYVEGGKLVEKTLIAEYKGEQFYVIDGYVWQYYDGLGVTSDGKYVIKEGKVDTSFNGYYGSNLVEKGKLVTDYTSEYESYEMKYRRIFGSKEIVHRTDAMYDSQAEADANMVPIEIKAWDFVSGESGEKYTRTFTIYINKAVAESVKKCFEEIYELPEQFPINSLGGYDYDYDSGQHGCGLAVDINPNENYYGKINDDGTVSVYVGTLYEPGVNPYSIGEDSEVAKVLNKYGFTQGRWGNWVDYMHFSYFGN